jgi:hypothetical protein
MGRRFFFPSDRVDRILDPLNVLSNEYLSTGVQRQRCEATHEEILLERIAM